MKVLMLMLITMLLSGSVLADPTVFNTKNAENLGKLRKLVLGHDSDKATEAIHLNGKDESGRTCHVTVRNTGFGLYFTIGTVSAKPEPSVGFAVAKSSQVSREYKGKFENDTFNGSQVRTEADERGQMFYWEEMELKYSGKEPVKILSVKISQATVRTRRPPTGR